jgi:hypothetical protein
VETLHTNGHRVIYDEHRTIEHDIETTGQTLRIDKLAPKFKSGRQF